MGMFFLLWRHGSLGPATAINTNNQKGLGPRLSFSECLRAEQCVTTIWLFKSDSLFFFPFDAIIIIFALV